MTVKNLNDFLGVLISVKDKNGDIPINKAMEASNLCNLDFSHFLGIAAEKNYVRYIDTQTYHLYPEALAAYKPRYKKVLLWFAKLLVLTMKNVIIYTGGVISGVLISWLSYCLIKLIG